MVGHGELDFFSSELTLFLTNRTLWGADLAYSCISFPKKKLYTVKKSVVDSVDPEVLK